MESAIDDALGKLAGLLAAVPHARVVENLPHAIPIDQPLVLVEALLDGQHRKRQVGPVVAAEGAFSEHAVADDARRIGAWRLQEVAVFVGVSLPLDEIAIHQGRPFQRLDLPKVAGVAVTPVAPADDQPLRLDRIPPVGMGGDERDDLCKHEIDVIAPQHDVNRRLIERLVGLPHRMVAGHDHEGVWQPLLQRGGRPPVELHHRCRRLENHGIRSRRDQVVQPCVKRLQLRVAVIPKHLVPKITQPRGGLCMGDRQEIRRGLEVLDVAILGYHRLLTVLVDDRRIRDGDFHGSALEKDFGDDVRA